MKNKKRTSVSGWLAAVCIIIFVLFLPFFLLYLLIKLLLTPIGYLNYKSSRYQKDFPHKYSWLRDPHIDNDAYTAVKEKELPIEYIKWSEDYDVSGYFVYKDILLDFGEPFFFDEEKGVFLCLPSAREEDNGQTEESTNEDEGGNADACLTVEGTRELILDGFKARFPEKECNRVLFFYSQKSAEKLYKEEGVAAMRSLDGFIIYKKNELLDTLEEFVANN